VAAAQQRGLFDDEIVPLTTVKQLFDKEGNVTGSEEVTLTRDEGNRADTTLESLAKLKPVWKNGQWVEQGQFITAGNASQLSDGASACVVMSADEARSRGLAALGTIAVWPWQAAVPMKWGSVPSMPSPSCSSSMG
jgi:acetyl-CoA C-acetyltransferase